MQAESNPVMRVAAVRRRLANEGPSNVRSAGDFELVAVPPSDCDALRDLLLAEKPRTVIEIGLAYGSSALAIGEALVAGGTDAARHLIIDAYQDHFHRAGWDAIVTAGLSDTCSLIEERSQIALPRLVAEGLIVDVAFVDGSHSFHNVFVDLFYIQELVRPGELVIMDDCNWPSVARAARYFELNTGWQAEPMAHVTRLRAFRLPNPRTEQNFANFKPFDLDATN